MLTLLSPEAAVAEWPDIGAAVGRVKGLDPTDVKKRLGLGTLQAWCVTGKARGWVLTSKARRKGIGDWALWIGLAVGKAGGRTEMLGIVRAMEQTALAWGCVAIRAETKRLGFLKVLPGWAHVGDVGELHILEKAL
jgi:hypothetical protein